MLQSHPTAYTHARARAAAPDAVAAAVHEALPAGAVGRTDVA